MIHQQTVERIHSHVGVDADHLAQHFHALFRENSGGSLVSFRNGDDQPSNIREPRWISRGARW